VRKQNSKIGRPRKVFQQGDALLSFTGRSVTSHAGMAIVARGMEHFNIREELKRCTEDLDVSTKYPTWQFLEQLVCLRTIGGEAMSDSPLLGDPAMMALCGWDGLADPTTFSRRLGRMRWIHNLGLEKIVTGLAERVRKPGKRLIAVDSTVASVFGEHIQGAELGYNPHKPGRDSYHPVLAVDVAARSVVDGYLRPGSCASAHGLDGFVRKLIAESTHPPEQTIFRLDKGLTSGAILDTIEAHEAGYVAKVKLTSKVMGNISRIKKWRCFGKGHFAANIRCQLDGWQHPRRMVVIERNLPPRKPDAQLPLFDWMEGRYEVVVTNLSMRAESIWRLYNRGTVVEQVIEELKNDFAAVSIRTKNFWANDALFLTGLIAYNLFNCIRRHGLPKALRTARIKRIGLLLLYLPANVVCRSRKLWIKIRRDHPMRLVFYQVMAALQ
jgi:hypothetical protein